MVKNLLLIIFVIFLFPATLLADEEKNKGKNIEEIKSHILSKMDKKISILNDFKSCVSSADSHDAIKSCRKQKKESMKAIKSKHKGKRKDKHKEKRKGKRKKHKKSDDDDDQDDDDDKDDDE
jgi:hypothetical protein